MLSLNSVFGRLALFVAGHVIVLGLVVAFSASVGQAGPDVLSRAVDTTTVTGSIGR